LEFWETTGGVTNSYKVETNSLRGFFFNDGALIGFAKYGDIRCFTTGVVGGFFAVNNKLFANGF
jgi:hypothetical protein